METTALLHPLDRRTDELAREFIAMMDQYGIAESTHRFGTWPAEPGGWVAALANVRADGWFIPTEFYPAPGFVVTRDATLYPLIQAAELADESMPTLPSAALPRVTDNRDLAPWTGFLHFCIAAAGDAYLERATRADTLEDRKSTMTSAFRSRMFERQIAPSLETFVTIDDEELYFETAADTSPLPDVQAIVGWLIRPPSDWEFTDAYGAALHPADCSYVITPRCDVFVLRQPGSLGGNGRRGPVEPIVTVPDARDLSFTGPLEPDLLEEADCQIETYIAVVCHALNVMDGFEPHLL